MTHRPNIVVIVMDTTRALDAYNPTVAPTLADLGEAGTQLPVAIAPAPWTLPSHASLMTGTYPSKHGAHAGHERLEDGLSTLPELFRAAGYETACVTNNTWFSIESGFDRGFEVFQQMWQLVQTDNAMGELVEITDDGRLRAVARAILDGNPLANVVNTLYHRFSPGPDDDGAARTTEWITDWLHSNDQDRPFFLVANYLEPHLEYRPPERLATEFLPDGVTYERAMDIPQDPFEFIAGTVDLDAADFRALRGLYRAEIAYLDEQLAGIRDALVDAGEWDDTILVVTADHGENIGDHGLMDHQYCLYDTLVHVPLVIHGGAFTGVEEPPELVSLVDLAPTLLDAVDVTGGDGQRGNGATNIDLAEATAQFQGHSFHPAASSEPREFAVSEYLAPQPSMDALERHVGDLPEAVYVYDRTLRAIRTQSHKFIRGSDGSRELYDLAVDPRERNVVTEVDPATATALGRRLDEWLDSFEHADPDGSVTIGEERAAHLESLGYLR